MKKFIFSAIAMVAFAGSSMANTIEVETVKMKTVETEEMRQLNTCDNVAAATYNAGISLGMSTSDAYEVSLGAYKACLKTNTPL